MFRDKKSYSQEMGEKMKSWRFDLDLMKVHSSESEDAKRELNRMLDELEDKFSLLEERLQDLEHGSSESWYQLKMAVDNAWEEAAHAINRAKTLLLH